MKATATAQLETHLDRDQLGATLVVNVGARWIRAAVFLGVPPGSHNGWWVTRWPPLFGLNYRHRVGGRWDLALTAFVHTMRKPTGPRIVYPIER
jgi:hypothetical protein